MADYRVTIDHATALKITDQLGDDVARVDALARTLQAIYGTAPLNFSHIEPYLGDAGDVPEWDLTDAIDSGDATKAIVVARRMLDSKGRAGLQIVNILQRHYLRMTKLEGSGVRNADEAGVLLGIKGFPAQKSLQMSQRLGSDRIATAVHWITDADIALKGWRQLWREGSQYRYGRHRPDGHRDPRGATGEDDPGRTPPLGRPQKPLVG